MNTSMDVYGKALLDYAHEKEEGVLMLNTSYGEPEEMPLWYFFREYEDMPDLEKMALSICEGKVLDVGAGTGSHALCLQQMGLTVTAIDTSKTAVDVMKESGVKDARQVDYFKLEGEKFDTILGLMNGIGFVGKKDRFADFLKKADELLASNGQIFIDSSDIDYLYEGEALPKDHYYGEVSFQYEYKGEKGEWFNWVYFDKDTMAQMADDLGWYCYFLETDEHGQYLARLVRK